MKSPTSSDNFLRPTPSRPSLSSYETRSKKIWSDTKQRKHWAVSPMRIVYPFCSNLRKAREYRESCVRAVRSLWIWSVFHLVFCARWRMLIPFELSMSMNDRLSSRTLRRFRLLIPRSHSLYCRSASLAVIHPLQPEVQKMQPLQFSTNLHPLVVQDYSRIAQESHKSQRGKAEKFVLFLAENQCRRVDRKMSQRCAPSAQLVLILTALCTKVRKSIPRSESSGAILNSSSISPPDSFARERLL